MKLGKKTNEWIHSWASSKYGILALFILAFIEAIFFPITPEILLIPLALGAVRKAYRFALVCGIGSVTGALVGYSVGVFACKDSCGDFTPFANFFFENIPGFTISTFYKIESLYNDWGFWVVFTGGFMPIPFKYFTISAGVFDLNLILFILASVISRASRYFLLAYLIRRYGEAIKHFIERYSKKVGLGLSILLAIGIILYIMLR